MILFTIHCSLFICPAGAQTFTERLQTVKGKEGRMTIVHSAEIDQLVNGPHARPATQATGAAAASQATGAAAKPATVTTGSATGSSTAGLAAGNGPSTPMTKTATTDRTSPVRDTVDIILNDQPRKKVMRNSYKITGYRVQAFAGGNQRKDKQKAEQVGSDIKQHFPDEPVYTHFYSPRWICRVGNYRTYEEAQVMLQNIRKLGYTSATIVKGKITVQY